MKKYLLLSLMASVPFIGSLTSCSSDPEFDDMETIEVSEAQFPYDSEGVWLNNMKPGFLNIDDYEFSHSIDEYNCVYGFTPSKVADKSEHSPLYSFPYASASGGGLTGAGSQYLVGYWGETLEGENCPWNERTCRIYAEDGDRFQPQSVMVCNNTYMLYSALNGSDFNPAVGPGDWVTLIAHGVHRDGTVGEATFYLINIEETDVEKGILTNWQKFDLTGLGTCIAVYFTMDCSENLKESWGMNLPTYFCLSNLVVKD